MLSRGCLAGLPPAGVSRCPQMALCMLSCACFRTACRCTNPSPSMNAHPQPCPPMLPIHSSAYSSHAPHLLRSLPPSCSPTAVIPARPAPAPAPRHPVCLLLKQQPGCRVQFGLVLARLGVAFLLLCAVRLSSLLHAGVMIATARTQRTKGTQWGLLAARAWCNALWLHFWLYQCHLPASHHITYTFVHS